jgi:hypothetical protein
MYVYVYVCIYIFDSGEAEGLQLLVYEALSYDPYNSIRGEGGGEKQREAFTLHSNATADITLLLLT